MKEEHAKCLGRAPGKCIALPAVVGQAWKIVEEVTFELTLKGECEIQQTKSTGRGNSSAKPPRCKRLKGWELQVLRGVEGLDAFGRKMGLDRPEAASC